MPAPSRLTPARAKHISDSIEAGATIPIAAETAGLGARTVARYLARGEHAEQQLRNHIETLPPQEQQRLDVLSADEFLTWERSNIPPKELPFWQLWQSVTRARAKAAERRIASIAEVGMGYESRRTVTVEKQVLGKDGEKVSLVETRTEVTFVRDWRAEAWWLEKQFREEFAVVTGVELTGKGGGPVETYDVAALKARALEMADEVAAKRRKRDRGRPVLGPPAPVIEVSG